MARAQLFSMDFVIAVAVLAAGIGLLMQSHEFAFRNQALLADAQSNAAQSIADAFVAGVELSAAPDHCVSYSNGSTDCQGFSCPKNVFVGRRLALCEGELGGQNACLMEVRACG